MTKAIAQNVSFETLDGGQFTQLIITKYLISRTYWKSYSISYLIRVRGLKGNSRLLVTVPFKQFFILVLCNITWVEEFHIGFCNILVSQSITQHLEFYVFSFLPLLFCFWFSLVQIS